MAQQVEQQLMERGGREDEVRETRRQPDAAESGWFPPRPRVESPYRRREPAHEFDFGSSEGMES